MFYLKSSDHMTWNSRKSYTLWFDRDIKSLAIIEWPFNLPVSNSKDEKRLRKEILRNPGLLKDLEMLIDQLSWNWSKQNPSFFWLMKKSTNYPTGWKNIEHTEF